MFKEFFSNCEIRDPVPVSEEQLNNIRSSLQKRLADNSQHKQPKKEEKAMTKTTTIRTLILAATVAAVGALSLIVSANTVPVSNTVLPEKPITASGDGEECDITFTVTDTDEETGDIKIMVDPDEYDYFYAQMEEKHPEFDHKAKDFFARTYAEIGRERLAEINDFHEQRLKEHLADEEKQMAELAEEDRVMAELAGKNTYTEEFNKIRKVIIANDKYRYNVTPDTITTEELDSIVTPADLDNLHLSPSYEDMDITELIVGETSYSDFKGMSTMLTDWGITLRHIEPYGGGSAVLIHPDGNGGYQYYKYRDSAPIVDEQLLAAIAEGTEKYGDTFTIYY